MIVRSFAPVCDTESRILILGSMPGAESLRRQQYYGHKQNAFWKLMCALLGQPETQDYQARLGMLIAHGIALWDVIQNCERKGSLDADIRNPLVNDFHAFFASHPQIRHVFFNGAKAHDTFRRYVGFDFVGLHFVRLGSTSPAHAVTFHKRLEDWRRILPYIKERP